MNRLVIESNPSGADDIYQLPVDAHAGLSESDSMRLNARLILLLANHVGDPQVIREAIDRAAAIRQETSPCT